MSVQVLTVRPNSTDMPLELLIEKGAIVDMKDESGMTPLFFAAVNGHKDCMELLLFHHANVNSKDYEGTSHFISHNKVKQHCIR